MTKLIKKLIRPFLLFIYANGRKLLGGKGLRNITPIAAIYRFISLQVKPEFVEVNGYKLYLDVVDGTMPTESFEKPTADLFKEQLGKMLKERKREDYVILDVGAEIGYYTCLAAKTLESRGKIFSFEPNLKSFSALKKSIEANNFENVKAFQKAASDSNGTGEFFVHGPSSTFGYHGYSQLSKRASMTTVESVTLDSFFPQNQKIDLIKMDIEGSETKAVKGAKSLLRNNRDVKLIIEFCPFLQKNAGGSGEELLDLLTDLGFKIYDLNLPNGLREPAPRDALLRRYPEKPISQDNMENIHSTIAVTNLFCAR